MMPSKPPLSAKSVGTVAIALVGPSFIWGLHFGIVYAIQPVFCEVIGGVRAGDRTQMAVIAATVIALLALLLLIAKPNVALRLDEEDRSRPFLTGVMRLLALLAFFGVLWAGSAALILPACKSLV
jgi:uncharacterized membrane protein